ncbi:MAG: hypothetical protein IPM79_38720 [Polyangiaceae bacterium]|nr:hypothetical protein [Polyangiaceae bacterium]MBK8943383.1 hypothetical protein [Polyangiaceae bacterium]
MPDPFSTQPSDPAFAARLAEVSRRFARLFEQTAPKSRSHALQAHRFALGPAGVARLCRARLAQDRIADLGVSSRRDAGSASTTWSVDASAPGALVACAVAACAASDGPVTVHVGPRASVWRDVSSEALAPLVEAAEVSLLDGADVPPGAATVGGSARLLVGVAPYYYSARDLERMALLVALELALPSPHAEGGALLLLPSGWDQGDAFTTRVESLAATLREQEGATGRELGTERLEARDANETLDALRARQSDDSALSVFVYPMWRERAEVEQRLTKLTRRPGLTIVNQTPALAWARGLAPSTGRVVVDVDQRLVPAARPGAAERRARYELRPSFGRALRAMLSAWTGL